MRLPKATERLLAGLCALTLALGAVAFADDTGTPTDLDPTPSPTPEATEAPTPEPTPEATPEPTPTATPKPSDTPTPTPTAKPTVTPVTISELTLVGALEDSSHVWHIKLDQDASLVFTWTLAGAETVQAVVTNTADEIARWENVSRSCTLAEAQLTEGAYTLTLTALDETGQAVTASLAFVLEVSGSPATDTDLPTPTPTAKPTATPKPSSEPKPSREPDRPEASPTPGGKPGQGTKPSMPARGKTGSSGKKTGVTPGQALTSTHAKGTGTMQLFGTVALETDGESMFMLTLGGETLAVSCGGEAFDAEIEDDSLLLISSQNSAWSLTLAALNTLNESGISELVFLSGDAEDGLDENAVLSTDLSLTGSAYGKERAQGYVASDFVLNLTEGQWQVQVEDRSYSLREGELIRND